MTPVFASRKNLSNKLTCFTRKKSPSSIAGMKCSFTNAFMPDKKKKLSPAVVPKNIKKCCKKWFVQARKFVYTNLNEAFVEKYVSIIQKNCFFWQENQRKWF